MQLLKVSDADGPDSPATVRAVVEGDLSYLGAIRSRDAEAGLTGRLSEESWASVLTELSRDSRSVFLVALVGSAFAGYAVATPSAVDAQRRVIARSPRLWLDVARSNAHDPRLLIPTIRRMGRLMRPLRPHGDPEFRLLDIVVAADFRGRGVGNALLSSTLASAEHAGHAAIGLSVLADNASAIRLYQRNGFVIDRRATRDDGRQVVTMSCRLEAPA